MKLLVLTTLLLLGSALAAGQERYVRPVDEAAKDASFAAFRSRLIEAAEKRDGKFVIGILDPKIELSYGGHQGIADFKKMWKPEDRDGEFWKTFLTVIKNGGRWETIDRRKIFAAPYTYSGFPDDLDMFEHFAVFGTDVNLRARPDTSADSIAKLSYNIVKIDFDGSVRKKTASEDEPGDPEWYKVETLGGKKGYIHSDFLRSSVDYRAGFEKKGGKWKMIFFIAGD